MQHLGKQNRGGGKCHILGSSCAMVLILIAVLEVVCPPRVPPLSAVLGRQVSSTTSGAMTSIPLNHRLFLDQRQQPRAQILRSLSSRRKLQNRGSRRDGGATSSGGSSATSAVLTATTARASPGPVGMREFQLAQDIDFEEVKKDLGRFRIFSYNVLADGPRYAMSDYHGYSPIECRRWKSRYPRIMSEISYYNPDIICLQEITRPMFQNSFYRDLQSNYTGLYAAKTDRRSKYQTSAMFVRTNRFKVLNGSLISFARMSEDYFRGLGAPFTGFDLVQKISLSAAHEGSFNDLDLMARAQDDKALIALLQNRETEQRFVAVSTHLYWNPKEPHVKALQAYLLSKAVNDFIERNGLDASKTPLAIAGDFNSLPNKTVADIYDPVVPPGGLKSGAYEGLTTGILPIKHPDHPQQRTKAECVRELKFAFELTSAYQSVFGEEPLMTTKTDKFNGTLDYIFVRNMKVASALAMPFDESNIDEFDLAILTEYSPPHRAHDTSVWLIEKAVFQHRINEK
eukprot:jgi/Bigna1/71892/fgenesh1_pg.17_\